MGLGVAAGRMTLKGTGERAMTARGTPLGRCAYETLKAFCGARNVMSRVRAYADLTTEAIAKMATHYVALGTSCSH